MVDRLYNDDKCGLVAAENLIVNDPPHKCELVKDKSLIKVPDNYLFVAGSCFAIRAKCLKEIKDLRLTIDDFELVVRGIFTFGHMMERAICFTVQNQGYDFCSNKVDRWRHPKYRKAEEKLRKLSTLNLYSSEDKGEAFLIDKDAAIRYFEMGFMSDYDIENVEVSKINKAPEVKRDSHYKEIEKKLKKGYDEKHLIVIDQNNNIIDGKYRVEILSKKSKSTDKIKVLRIKTIPVDVSKVKAFSAEIVGA